MSLSTGCPHGCQGYQWNLTYHHTKDCILNIPAATRRRECERAGLHIDPFHSLDCPSHNPQTCPTCKEGYGL